MTDSIAALLQTRLNRYEIHERLSAGGMDRVYRAHDSELDRPVAIKILRHHLSDDSAFKERFEREARLLAGLNHPNIVQIYDFDSLQSDRERIYYMVMPYLPGPTLQTVMQDLVEKGQRLSHERIQSIMDDLTAALGFAHDRGIVHHDVKPANILFNGQGRAIVTDFGLVRLAQSRQLTQEGITIGTPTYMSPEQATGGEIDARSDIYALGVILYEMLTGHPPFADESSISILLKHVKDPVPSPFEHMPDKNPYLDAVIFRALAKPPEERYQTAEALAEDLRSAFSGKKPEIDDMITRELEISGPLEDHETLPNLRHLTRARQANRSPWIFLAVGSTIIITVLFLHLLSQQPGQVTTPDDALILDVEPLHFVSTFEADDETLPYWPQGQLSALSREITGDGQYRIASQRAGQAIATIFAEGSNYKNIVIELTGTLQDGSATTSGYGIIFRYVDEDNYNVFAVDGVGRYSLWLREDGQWVELRNSDNNWTPDDAVNPIGESNMLMVEIIENYMRGYVNGEQVTIVADKTIATGRLGIYIASPPNGETTVLIEEYRTLPTATSLMEAIAGREGNVDDDDSASE
jgi:serine/threonine protein kinase